MYNLLLTDFAKASVSTHLYKYKELKSVTRGFRVDNKLGEGGIGEVYLVWSLTDNSTPYLPNLCQPF